MAKKSDKRRDETMLATIRINAGLWQDFQELAKRMNTSASALVVGHIERCLVAGGDTDIVQASQAVNTDVASRTYIDAVIQMEQVRNELLAGITDKLEGELLPRLVGEAVEAALSARGIRCS